MLRKTIIVLSVGLAFFATVLVSGNCLAKDLLFGMTGRDLSPPYAKAMEVGAENKCKELGVKLVTKDSQNDVLKQMAQMDSFLVMGVDGLIFEGTIDTRAVIKGIEKYNAKGIPIVALDNSPEGGKVAYWISFDIVEASRKAGETFIRGIKSKHGGKVPKGVILEITGALGDAFATECIMGLHSVTDQYPQLKVVQGEGMWNNIDSLQRTSELLTRYKDEVVGIYVHTPDVMGQGAVKAVENAGLDPADYFISGICMGPEGCELIKDGKIYAIVQQPAMAAAEIGVQLLYDMITGKNKLPMEGEVLTRANAVWSPAPIIKNPRGAAGLMIKLNAPLIPFDAPADDARLWENKLAIE